MTCNTEPKRALRLIYPQWRGAHFTEESIYFQKYFAPLNFDVFTQGYGMGARLTALLLPPPSKNTLIHELPQSYDLKREAKDGIMDKDFHLKYTRLCLDTLDIIRPDRITVTGGDCSSAAAPFAFLAKQEQDMGGKAALLWIDAHPDITVPYDPYDGYHAMAHAALLGKIDEDFKALLPATIDPHCSMMVGISDWERDEVKARADKLKLRYLEAKDCSNLSSVEEFLKSCGATSVLIHLDLDVLDCNELDLAVGHAQNGLKIAQVIAIINLAAKVLPLKGLCIAEHLPKRELMLQGMMHNLSLPEGRTR